MVSEDVGWQLYLLHSLHTTHQHLPSSNRHFMN